MRKGITPIISIIVLLLITVSLAGAAYLFLSGYVGGLTGRAIQVTGTCLGGSSAFITVTNLGNQQIDLGNCDTPGSVSGTSTVCGDITVVRVDAGGDMDGQFDTDRINASASNQQSAAHFTDAGCGTGNRCEYAFTRPGEWQPAEKAVQC
jgi:flagellin-like protein